MKYNILLFSIIISTTSFAMEIEIRNRELDSLNKPHITIINLLPTDNALFSTTRIDISDKTKVDRYIKDSYRPDNSTKTIYSGQGIRFSPWLNKNGESEHKRLGMNDAGNAALITLYIHGASNNPLNHLVIGKGSQIPFNDTITITAKPDGIIYFDGNDDTIHWKTEITSDPEKEQVIGIIGMPDPRYLKLEDINFKKRDIVHAILQINHFFGCTLLTAVFLIENPYIYKLFNTSENDTKNLEENNAYLLCNLEQYSAEEIIEKLMPNFNQYLQEHPDFEEAWKDISSSDSEDLPSLDEEYPPLL